MPVANNITRNIAQVQKRLTDIETQHIQVDNINAIKPTLVDKKRHNARETHRHR